MTSFAFLSLVFLHAYNPGMLGLLLYLHPIERYVVLYHPSALSSYNMLESWLDYFIKHCLTYQRCNYFIVVRSLCVRPSTGRVDIYTPCLKQVKR